MTPPTAKATQSSRAFRMECAVAINVQASPEKIWRLLTNAADFPRWNTTVSKIDGTIAAGERLALQVPAAPGRTFKPRVTRFEPAQTMEWSDGFAPMFRGVRTFSVVANGDGTTTFSMVEVFRGLMLPMIKRSLPDFGPAFETYAADLKREAERNV
jgi:hypothetical protein